MKNIKTSLKGSILTIVCDIAAPAEESSSGKSLTVASTEGNVTPEGLTGDWKLGLNLYKKNPEYVKPAK